MNNINEVSIISSEEYIKLYENDRASIGDSVIIPPKIGEPGFGKILIDCRNYNDIVTRHEITGEKELCHSEEKKTVKK